MKVNEHMQIDQILEIHNGLADVLLAHGLNCRGCPGAAAETLAEAAEGHGADLEKILEDLNQFLIENK